MIAALSALLILSGAPADTATASSRPALKMELERLRTQMRDVEAQLDRIGRNESDALKELENIDRSVQQARRSVERLESDLKLQNRQLSSLRDDETRLRREVEEKKGEMNARLRAFYKFGRLAWLKMLFSPADLQSLPRHVKYLSSLGGYDLQRLRTFTSSLDHLKRKEKRIQEAKKAIQVRLARLDRERAALESRSSQKQTLLTELHGRREFNIGLLKELERAAGELQQLLSRLDTDTRPEDAGACRIEQEKGRLPWPVRGRLATSFGPRFDAGLGARLYSNGIVIEAQPGVPARAVCDGVAIFADWFRSYGQILIVSHGDHYYSIYGHASELLKRKGEPVAAGEPVALTGETGAAGGSGLYFEIRHRNTPLDPLEWLIAP
ncbi:MAG: peptidoglycan DD-metalloendopeptidase family protein [Nitrospirae bacterium]|nr:peptidoglycan DD-metalloendopeptidase family protein [Nitrospirota bacterium]